MRVLLDTQILLGLLRQSLAQDHPRIARHLADSATVSCASVASLWEIAIKARLGKLQLSLPLDDLPGYFAAIGLALLPIQAAHVIASAEPQPETRDPFDRLLLAQCQIEGLLLVTVDRALLAHPLAVRLAPSSVHEEAGVYASRGQRGRG